MCIRCEQRSCVRERSDSKILLSYSMDHCAIFVLFKFGSDSLKTIQNTLTHAHDLYKLSDFVFLSLSHTLRKSISIDDGLHTEIPF